MYLPNPSLVPNAILVVIVFLLYKLLNVGKRDPRMPPGPPTLPIVGNLHQVPLTGVYKKFRDWASEYGPVYSLKFGPANVLVLVDREAVHDLIVKKGNIYSDRPESYVGEILTKGDHMALTSVNNVWREKRKIVSHHFSPRLLDEKHHRVQEAEATILLNDLLEDPERFYSYAKRYPASVACSIIFGQRAKSFDDFWGSGVYEVMEKWTASMEPGANPPVDIYKFLRYIPRRLAYWKRRAIDAGNTMDAVWTEARRRVDERRAQGIRRDSMVDSLIDQYEKNGWAFDQHGFNNLMGEIVEGAADTTANQILTLILAFGLHPEVQVKARQEIDRVCENGRPPTWADFANLPYVNAIVKEGMRWRPTAVSGLPHALKEDDWYKGWFIPKGTTVFIATWAIHHSDKFYKDPEVFNPDRFQGYNKLANDYAGNPDWATRDHYNYGAGRRICPGIHLAERSLWRIASKLLWAFEFSEAIDPVTSAVIRLDPEAYNPGILQGPLPFKIQIKPRSDTHIDLIKQAKQEADVFLEQYA